MSSASPENKTVEKVAAKKVAAKEAQPGLLDGIVNPAGLLVGGVGLIFLLGVPVTGYVATEDGRFHYVLVAFIRFFLPNALAVPDDRVIPAIAALYTFFTFGLTGALSGAASASASERGLDRSHPRAQAKELQGFPLRMHSAHYNLMEMFPGFAVSAALAQVLAPTNQQIVNLLGLHAIAKILVYYPTYLLDIPAVRTSSHIVATSSVVNVLYLLAMGAK